MSVVQDHHHQQQHHTEQHYHHSNNHSSQQQQQEDQRQKLLNKRKLVIQEIFQTEKEYVNALETLDTVFITPIKQLQLLKEEDTNELFKDIQIILAVNKEVFSFIDIFIKYMEDHNYNDEDLNISNNNNNNNTNNSNSNTLDVVNNTTTTISPSTPTNMTPINTTTTTASQPTTPTPTSSANTSTTNTSSSSSNNKEIEQKKRNALILAKKITPTLGDIFHLMSDYLKSYSSYCNKYELIFKMIEEKKQKKSKFRKFLEKTEFTPDAFNDSIISFMIKPVQRIPRYEMLLRESIKTTPQDHHDYSRLISAAQKINNVASRVNEKIREQLCRERAIQLSNQFNSDQLPFELVKSSRKFIAHTIMGYISDNRGIQMRCFILYNDLILLCNYTGINNSNNSNNNNSNPSNSSDQMMTQFFNSTSNNNNTNPSNGNTNNNTSGGGGNININETYSMEQKKKESEIFDNPKVKFHLRCAISLLSTPLTWAESLPDGYCIENAFKLVTRDKTFILFTENKYQRDYWVQLINDQMDKLKKQLPNLNDQMNANEIMLVNSRYFYYASGSEKEKRIEMLNSQMSDSNERLKIESSIQEDHLSLILDQIQKDVDHDAFDQEYINSMNYLKLQPSHPLSHSHSQHRLSVNSNTTNNSMVQSPMMMDYDINNNNINNIGGNGNGSGNNLLANLSSPSLSNLSMNNSSSNSLIVSSNNNNTNQSSKRNSTSIKGLFGNNSNNSSSPISVPHSNSLSLSNLYDSPHSTSPPVYLSPNSSNNGSHHQTGHLSASIALRQSSTSPSSNRDRSNSLYNTRIVIPQQRNSQSPTILKELFQKINTEFNDDQSNNNTTNSNNTSHYSLTSNNSNSGNSSNNNGNGNNSVSSSNESFTRKLTVKMMSKFKKSGQKKKIQDTDQMVYLSDGEGEVDEPFSSNLLSYMQDVTKRRIDMQYFDEFVKLQEKHSKQFDPLIQELQFGSKPQHNVDKLLNRRKVSEINDNDSDNVISYNSNLNGSRYSVCSSNDEVLPSLNTTTSIDQQQQQPTEITVTSPIQDGQLLGNEDELNDIDNELSILHHSTSTTSTTSTSTSSDNLFSTITEQIVKLNPNKVIPLMKEHVIEEIANTKYSTVVFNPLYGLKDLPTTRRYRLQYIDEFKDWSESSVDSEYSNFLKNFSDKFGIPSEITTNSTSPSRSSNADIKGSNTSNTTATSDNDKKRRSLFFWK